MSWTQLNPNVWQRVYADETVGIVSPDDRGSENFTCEAYGPDGYFDCTPLGTFRDGTLDEMKAALDKRFDPQPEVVRRTDTSIYFEHKGKSAFARQFKQSGWYVTFGDRETLTTPSGKDQDEAEKLARTYVLGTP